MYHVDFHIEYPASMSHKDFLSIWASEVETAEIKEALRKRMHQPIPEQGALLKQVVTGFYNYHAPSYKFLSCAAYQTWHASVPRYWFGNLILAAKTIIPTTKNSFATADS